MSDYINRKVLLVGNVFGREMGNEYYMIMPKLLHGFIRLGCNLYVFNDREVARGSTPFLSTGPGRRAANRKLIETARNFRPDLLLMGHSEPIENATLETLRRENPALRIAFRNVDTLTDTANRARLLRRADTVDAIFVTSAAPIHGVPSDCRAKVYFMPNPVDPAVDTGRAFARSDQDFDLFFAVGTGDGSDERVRFLLKALQRLPQLKADIRGLPGSAPLRGAAFLEAMNNARMGFSMSRPDNVYLYASDRMSQLLGNGLLTFVSRSTGFQDLFAEDQIAFFGDLEELVGKLDYFARHDTERRRVAEAGWRAAHSMFASHRIAKYILERSFAEPLSESYPWPTENTESTADPIPQESSIA
ncbi:glycosyltransferase [Pelagibius sp. CAU 1746]|uniref:glycosyltransferase family protein n=1 Tax=Pelagibius sp. CAU 1746 TaxID=3140370 RepID=UPI00325A7B7C